MKINGIGLYLLNLSINSNMWNRWDLFLMKSNSFQIVESFQITECWFRCPAHLKRSFSCSKYFTNENIYIFLNQHASLLLLKWNSVQAVNHVALGINHTSASGFWVRSLTQKSDVYIKFCSEFKLPWYSTKREFLHVSDWSSNFCRLSHSSSCTVRVRD